MIETGWFLLLALLPLAAYAMAICRRRRFWHTRTVPADGLRFGAGIALPALLDPALGVLATSAVGWWAWMGWERRSGAGLWFTISVGLWIGLKVDGSVLALALAVLLAVAVVEVGFAIVQRFDLPLPLGFKADQVHGTLGHRTGLATYLALAVPLAFLTDAWVWLVPIYLGGLALVPAFDAALALAVGGLLVAPRFGWLALAAGAGLWCLRAIGRDEAGHRVYRFRLSRMDTWKTRRVIWRTTWRRARRWPAWLVGYGAGSFEQHARRWRRHGLTEVFREAHNDWLELFYEYGLIGLLAIGWWIWRVSGGFAVGDPVTAAAASFAVAMLGNFPIRVAPLAAVALILAVLLMRRQAGLAW